MSTGGTTRRRLLTAGAVAVGSTLLTAPEAFADGYGSGALGPWENSSKAISTLTQIRPVLDTDGLFMFGDSISVHGDDVTGPAAPPHPPSTRWRSGPRPTACPVAS